MIPLFLAQHSPEYTAGIFYGVIGVLFFLLVVLVMAKQLRRDPPLHKEYVSRKEHETLASKIEEDRRELSEKISQGQTALEDKMDKELGRERGARKLMHEEIAELQASVDVVKTQNQQQSDALADLRSDQNKLRDRIDDIPKRTIDLLRSVVALKPNNE